MYQVSIFFGLLGLVVGFVSIVVTIGPLQLTGPEENSARRGKSSERPV